MIGLLTAHPKLATAVRRHAPHDFGVPAISRHELIYNICRGQDQARYLAAVESLRPPVVEFDREDARQAGEIRAALAALGAPIGPHDALIAGRAQARDLVLITRNAREFSRIDGPRVEDWQN